MVAHLIALRTRLMINSWKRSVWQLIFAILGALYGLMMLAFLVVGLILLMPDLELGLRGTILALGSGVVVIGWLVIPLFLTGTDPTLEPKNFATFGIPTRTLVSGLALGGLTTTAGGITLLVFLATLLAWLDHPLAVLAGIPSVIAGALFCICLAHAVTGMLSAYTGQRRVREIASLVAFIPLMLGGIILVRVIDTVEELSDQLPGIASALTWSPLGSWMGVPWAVAEGNWLIALAQMVLCIVWLSAAVALWSKAVRRSLEHTPASSPATKNRTGTGLLGLMPATPAGAIAARSLIYWLKDPRYSASLIVVPLMLVLLWFFGSQNDGASWAPLIAGPLVGMLLGYAISADVSYDGTAFSLHVTAGVSGRDDRVGRVGALLLWALPVTVVLTVISLVMAGDVWSITPGLIGLSVSLLLVGAGVSAVTSARFIYPVPPPGASPFATPPGGMGRIMVIQIATMGITCIMAIPTAIPLIVGLVSGHQLWHWITLFIGLGFGVFILLTGIRLGAKWYDRSQSETYQTVLKFAK